MKSVAIVLEPEEQIRLHRIVMDDDQEEGLEFLKTCIFPKMDTLARPHCVPVFEESYGPGQKDQFEE